MSTSDTDIEKILLARLHELEKSVSWIDSSCIETARDLKKHRMKLVKSKVDDETKLPKIRFLNAVHDESSGVSLMKSATPLPQNMIDEASESVFAFRRDGQPTLTQMMEPRSSNNADLCGTKCAESMTKTEGIGRPCSGQFNIEGHLGKTDTSLDKENAYRRGKHSELWEASKSISCGNKCATSNAIGSPFIETKGEGIDQLLSMFENFEDELYSDQTKEIKSDDSIDTSYRTGNYTKYSCVTLSQLTPDSRALSSSMEKDILSDSRRAKLLDSECPQWRENVRFAFDRKDPIELKSALSRVKASRQKLKEKRMKLLELLDRKDSVLQLYENVISLSLQKTG